MHFSALPHPCSILHTNALGGPANVRYATSAANTPLPTCHDSTTRSTARHQPPQCFVRWKRVDSWDGMPDWKERFFHTSDSSLGCTTTPELW